MRAQKARIRVFPPRLLTGWLVLQLYNLYNLPNKDIVLRPPYPHPHPAALLLAVRYGDDPSPGDSKLLPADPAGQLDFRLLHLAFPEGLGKLPDRVHVEPLGLEEDNAMLLLELLHAREEGIKRGAFDRVAAHPVGQEVLYSQGGAILACTDLLGEFRQFGQLLVIVAGQKRLF